MANDTTNTEQSLETLYATWLKESGGFNTYTVQFLTLFGVMCTFRVPDISNAAKISPEYIKQIVTWCGYCMPFVSEILGQYNVANENLQNLQGGAQGVGTIQKHARAS